jgi:hypothetical protein
MAGFEDGVNAEAVFDMPHSQARQIGLATVVLTERTPVVLVSERPLGEAVAERAAVVAGTTVMHEASMSL